MSKASEARAMRTGRAMAALELANQSLRLVMQASDLMTIEERRHVREANESVLAAIQSLHLRSP